jgi:hypothetical protein
LFAKTFAYLVYLRRALTTKADARDQGFIEPRPKVSRNNAAYTLRKQAQRNHAGAAFIDPSYAAGLEIRQINREMTNSQSPISRGFRRVRDTIRGGDIFARPVFFFRLQQDRHFPELPGAIDASL